MATTHFSPLNKFKGSPQKTKTSTRSPPHLVTILDHHTWATILALQQVCAGAFCAAAAQTLPRLARPAAGCARTDASTSQYSSCPRGGQSSRRPRASWKRRLLCRVHQRRRKKIRAPLQVAAAEGCHGSGGSSVSSAVQARGRAGQAGGHVLRDAHAEPLHGWRGLHLCPAPFVLGVLKGKGLSHSAQAARCLGSAP